MTVQVGLVVQVVGLVLLVRVGCAGRGLVVQVGLVLQVGLVGLVLQVPALD